MSGSWQHAWRSFPAALLVSLAAAPAAAQPFVAPRDAHAVAYSSDGRLAVIGFSGQANDRFPPGPHPSPRKCGVVQWFDVDSGQRLWRKETYGDLTKVAFSRDGALVAAARLFTTLDRIALHEVRLWNAQTGQPALVLDRCHTFDFCPTRDEIVVLSRRRCVVYRLPEGEKLRELPAAAAALSVCWSPDGARVAVILARRQQFSIALVDGATGQLLAETAGLDEPFYTVTFSADGRRLASGHVAGNVLLWDADSLELRGRMNSGGAGLQHPFFSPDGTLLGAGDQRNSDVVFWNLASGEELRRYTFKQGSFPTYHARSGGAAIAPEKAPHRFAFAPDSQAFLAGPYGGMIRLISTGRDIRRFGN